MFCCHHWRRRGLVASACTVAYRMHLQGLQHLMYNVYNAKRDLTTAFPCPMLLSLSPSDTTKMPNSSSWSCWTAPPVYGTDVRIPWAATHHHRTTSLHVSLLTFSSSSWRMWKPRPLSLACYPCWPCRQTPSCACCFLPDHLGYWMKSTGGRSCTWRSRL